MFPAVQPTIATVPPGEKVLHTARINPCKYEARGGFLLKITLYHPEGTEHRMHLTEGHILIEPSAPSAGSYLLSGVLLAALGYAVGEISHGTGFQKGVRLGLYGDVKHSVLLSYRSGITRG